MAMQACTRALAATHCAAFTPAQRPPRPSLRAMRVHCTAQPQRAADADAASASRREIILSSVNTAVLGALFTWGATPRPSGLGVQDYGGGVRTLALCPPSPNCVSTAEEVNDPTHFVPGWNYNRGERRRPPLQRVQRVEHGCFERRRPPLSRVQSSVSRNSRARPLRPRP